MKTITIRTTNVTAAEKLRLMDAIERIFSGQEWDYDLKNADDSDDKEIYVDEANL